MLFAIGQFVLAGVLEGLVVFEDLLVARKVGRFPKQVCDQVIVFELRLEGPELPPLGSPYLSRLASIILFHIFV